VENDRFEQGRWADDLSWIVGRLRHTAVEGGYWALEFGPDSAPEGGQVLLGRPHALRDARDGDLVRVEGTAQPLAVTIFMSGTPYELDAVEWVEA
jgi:hypothetical protein